jgi:hypothetical protein
MEFDGWELMASCARCGRQDNFDKMMPVTFLDVKTKLCEFCFGELPENQEEEE